MHAKDISVAKIAILWSTVKSSGLQHHSPTHSVDYYNCVQEAQDEDTDIMILSGSDTDADIAMSTRKADIHCTYSYVATT